MHGVRHPVLLAGGRRAPRLRDALLAATCDKGCTLLLAAAAAGDATLVDLLLDLSHGDCPGEGDSDGDDGDGGDGDAGDGGGDAMATAMAAAAMAAMAAAATAMATAMAAAARSSGGRDGDVDGWRERRIRGGGEHREVVALLLKRTHLPLDGRRANNDGLVPLQCCSAAFRNDVESLAEMIHEDHAALRRSVGTRRLLHGGRYLLCSVISPKVQLAQDLQRGGRSVALKYYATSEEAEHEEQVMRLVGPQTAPEVYERFYDESGCGERRHVLAMQAADVLSDLALFCQRERVLQGRLSLRHYALKLLQCVHALHKKGMVHTDIKTKHFMRFGGEWKLVDYDNATMENETCQPSCTIRYAAPEVVAARVGAGVVKVTRAVDAWAMGHVLYDLFAGEPLLSTDDGEVELEALHADPEAAVRKLHAAGKHLLTEPQKRCSRRSSSPTPRSAPRSTASSTSRSSRKTRTPSRAGSSRCSRSSVADALKTATASSRLLMKEIGFLQEAIPHRLRDIRPAACFPADIKKAVQELSPRVLQFSGHGDAPRRGPMAGALAFEMADGTIQLPDPDDFIELLGPASCPHLQCALNGCKTVRPLGEAIVAALPHLTVIGWDSITLDAACRLLARLYDELGKGCDRRRRAGAVDARLLPRGGARLPRQGLPARRPGARRQGLRRPPDLPRQVRHPARAGAGDDRRALRRALTRGASRGAAAAAAAAAAAGRAAGRPRRLARARRSSRAAATTARREARLQEEPLPTRPTAAPPARRKITTAPH